MQTIHITQKNAVSKGIFVDGYIHPNSNHNTLMIGGLSMVDLIKVRDYQSFGAVANNVVTIDLRENNFSILDI